jgi:hypothetical protein
MEDAEKYRLVAQSLRARAREIADEAQLQQLRALAEHFEKLSRDALSEMAAPERKYA